MHVEEVEDRGWHKIIPRRIIDLSPCSHPRAWAWLSDSTTVGFNNDKANLPELNPLGTIRHAELSGRDYGRDVWREGGVEQDACKAREDFFF